MTTSARGKLVAVSALAASLTLIALMGVVIGLIARRGRAEPPA